MEGGDPFAETQGTTVPGTQLDEFVSEVRISPVSLGILRSRC